MGTDFRKRSCSDNKIDRDDDSKKSHPNLGPTLEKEDERRDYGEIRMQAIGQVGEDIVFVVYTDRGDARHIISARLASRKERSLWHSFAAAWKASGA